MGWTGRLWMWVSSVLREREICREVKGDELVEVAGMLQVLEAMAAPRSRRLVPSGRCCSTRSRVV